MVGGLFGSERECTHGAGTATGGRGLGRESPRRERSDHGGDQRSLRGVARELAIADRTAERADESRGVAGGIPCRLLRHGLLRRFGDRGESAGTPGGERQRRIWSE